MAADPPREGGGPNPPYGEDFFQRIVNVHWGATGPQPPVFIMSRIWFRVAPDGLWNGSPTADPATGVGGIELLPVAGVLYPSIHFTGTPHDSGTVNFGASDFVGVVPSGFGTRPSATWNPADITGNTTLSNGNLTATSGGGILGGLFAGVRATVGADAGDKFYWEVTFTKWTEQSRVGMSTADAGLGSIFGFGTVVLHLAGNITVGMAGLPGSQPPGNLGLRSSGDVIGIAVEQVTARR